MWLTHTIPDLCGFTTIPDLWLTHTISTCGSPTILIMCFTLTISSYAFHPHDSWIYVGFTTIPDLWLTHE
jgi:hypothetical protein